jgi:cytochrome c-type biogenesis protein CcmH
VHLALKMSYTLSPIGLGLFWLIVLALLVGAAWWVLRAGAAGETIENDRADLTVYADQVGEIDRDLAQGRIGTLEAGAARLEIGRRLVKAQNRQIKPRAKLDRVFLGVLAGGISLLAGGLYFLIGSPGRADLPFQAREQELLSRDPSTLSGDEILLLLQERARIDPNDPKPHALMGQVLASTGRDQDALRAYQAVLRRTPNDSEAIAEAAGILMRLNGNQLGEDAKAALNAALTANPKSPSARYYLGLVEWQEGRRAVAIAAWQSAYDAIADQPEAQTTLAARVVQTMSVLERGPSDGAAAGQMAAMNGADQGAVIKNMIASREARLAAAPDDIALRLSVVRVLVMSNQSERARQVLLKGLERGEDEPFTLALYEVAARSLAPAQAPALAPALAPAIAPANAPATPASSNVTKR